MRRWGWSAGPTWHLRDQHMLLSLSGDSKQRFYFKSHVSEGQLTSSCQWADPQLLRQVGGAGPGPGLFGSSPEPNVRTQPPAEQSDFLLFYWFGGPIGFNKST